MTIKTHKGTKKRIKVTGTKQPMYKGAGMSHLLEGKSKNRKNRLKKDTLVTKTKVKKIKALIQAY